MASRISWNPLGISLWREGAAYFSKHPMNLIEMLIPEPPECHKGGLGAGAKTRPPAEIRERV